MGREGAALHARSASRVQRGGERPRSVTGASLTRGLYRKRSPASRRSRRITRDLARSTAFSGIPSSAATCAAGRPSSASRQNAAQVVAPKSPLTAAKRFCTTCSSCSRSHSRASVAFGIAHLVQESRGAIHLHYGEPAALLAKVLGLIRRDRPQPGPERTFPPPFKPGELADHDDEHLLGQVVGLGGQPRDCAAATAG